MAFTGFFTCRDMGPQPVKGLATRIEFRCSPYHQNSTFYPLIEHLQRVLQFTVGETPQEKLGKLEQTLAVTIFT